MKITRLQFSETGLFGFLLPYLKDRVFHVTNESNFDSILNCGEIRPNKEGPFHAPFGFSGNAFFRNRGCISLFDYRPETKAELDTQEKIDFYLFKCMPTLPATPETGIAILFIFESVYPALLPWTLWKEEEAWVERVVPYFETGHHGPIALKNIEEALLVSVLEDENPDPIIVALRRARRRRAC